MESINSPHHVAIIMDGNGRWAQSRKLPRTQGHIEGVKRVEEIVEIAYSRGVRILTLYTFSTENWTRPETEIALLMNTLTSALNNKKDKLNKNSIKFRIIGRRPGIPANVLKVIEEVERSTKDNQGLILNLAFNYGSRQEIIDGIRAIAQNVIDGKINVADINEKVISDSLYTRDLPDPDFLIRTSGEQRVSNFLLWQCSYSEFYFVETLWPDFTVAEFDKALEIFKGRERRFGAIESTRKT